MKLRSSLEEKVIQQLDIKKVKYGYEAIKLKYQKKPSVYTPDLLLDNGIIIEIKGYFDAEDRAKHLLVQEQHPDKDIRFLFQSAKKKLHKASSTTYGGWCDKHGFKWAEKEIPEDWIKEEKGEGKELIRTDKKPRLRRTAKKDTKD